MRFPPILSVGPLIVEDSGIPNKERIVFRPTEPINLVEFGILIGVRQDNGLIRTIHDNCFMFDEIEVAVPSWVVVYTKKGVPCQRRRENPFRRRFEIPTGTEPGSKPVSLERVPVRKRLVRSPIDLSF